MPNSSIPRERERRWLVDPVCLPDLSGYIGEHITQGYLSAQGSTPVFRVRLCHDLETYALKKAVQTVKAPTDDGMAEVEFNLPEQVAHQLLSLAKAKPSKTRYQIPHSRGQLIELDVFKGWPTIPDGQLVIAEIELPSFDTSVVVPS